MIKINRSMVDIRLLKFLLELNISSEKELDDFIQLLSKVKYEDFLALTYFLSFEYKINNGISSLRYKIKTRKYSNEIIDALKLCCDIGYGIEFERFLFSNDYLKYQNMIKLIYKCISNNYVNKDDLLKSLNKLLELGINTFEYIPQSNIDGVYIGKICKNMNDLYDIEWVYSDGMIEYLPKIQDYQFSITNAKYVILNRKCSSNICSRYHSSSMIVNDLNFDINTLPTIEQLSYPNVIPIIPNEIEDLIEAKTKAINNIYDIEASAKEIKNILEELRDILKEITTTNVDDEVWENILKTLDSALKLPNYLTKFNKQLNREYIDLGIMKQEELKTGLVRKKKYELDKKFMVAVD